MTRYNTRYAILPMRKRFYTRDTALSRINFIFNDLQCINQKRNELVQEIVNKLFDDFGDRVPQSRHQKTLIAYDKLKDKHTELKKQLVPLLFLRKRLNRGLLK